MSSWHGPGDAVLAAQGGCPCVPVSVCECLRVASWPPVCSCPLWPPQPRAASVGKIPPEPHPCPGPPCLGGSKVAESQPSSAQINKLSWRPQRLSFVWLAHRLAPCQNVRCELRKDAERDAVSWVKPRLFIYLTCELDLVEKWFYCSYILTTVLVM